MTKVRVYFLEIEDQHGMKHQLKSTDYKKIFDFDRRYKGKINGIKHGSRLVSEDKINEIITEIGQWQQKKNWKINKLNTITLQLREENWERK